MFFLMRSVVCIGIVAVLATGGGKTGIGRVIPSGGRDAVQSLGRACVASNECLRLGMGLVTTAARIDSVRTAVPSERSADTLTGSDLEPAWIAPGVRRAVMSSHLHPGTLARL